MKKHHMYWRNPKKSNKSGLIEVICYKNKYKQVIYASMAGIAHKILIKELLWRMDE